MKNFGLSKALVAKATSCLSYTVIFGTGGGGNEKLKKKQETFFFSFSLPLFLGFFVVAIATSVPFGSS